MTSFGLEIMGEPECRALLEAHAFGRVAISSGPHPAVLPVLYGMFDGDVVFRTAPGEKLIAAVLGQEIVFEIDAMEPARKTGWSVNVVGHAHKIVNQIELQRVSELGIEPWAGAFRDDYVRIHTAQVTGRRIRADHGTVAVGP